MIELLMRRRGMAKVLEVPLENQYLTFEALESGTFSFTNNCEYSLNGGAWTSYTAADALSVSEGDMVKWRATLTPTSSAGIGTFSSSGEYNAMGNPLSLRSGDNFVGVTTLPNNTYMFFKLFRDSTKLISVKNLSLPFMTLRNYCYQQMFYGCTGLIETMPTLPAINASTNGSAVYRYMFQNCTSLTTAPEIMLQTTSTQSLQEMFSGCSSLVTVPHLHTTSIGKQCCDGMFKNCTSLVSAPKLPAMTLNDSYNYQNMFYGCTSLVNAPALPATTVPYACYQYMFEGCTSLVNAPVLPAATLNTYSYRQMFRNCSALKYIKCLAITKTASNCLQNWVQNVPSGGTFVKHPDAEWSTGNAGIPSGWTVEDAVIE